MKDGYFLALYSYKGIYMCEPKILQLLYENQV